MRRRFLIVIVLSVLIASPMSALASPFNHAGGRVALVIGIDHFAGRTRPNVGGVGDALAFQELLRRSGWRDDQVRVLTDGNATAAGMRAGMQWLVDNCFPTFYCVFHYSGHVKQMGAGDATGGAHEYLWPYDGRFISDDEFAGYMRQLQGLAWIDISGCEPAGFDHGISSPRRLFTAAAQESEKGFEDPGLRRSIWTHLLVDEGMLLRKADANADGHATLNEAIQYAVPRAPQLTAGQSPSPQHPYTAGGQEGDWFGPPPPPAPAKRSCLLILCF